MSSSDSESGHSPQISADAIDRRLPGYNYESAFPSDQEASSSDDQSSTSSSTSSEGQAEDGISDRIRSQAGGAELNTMSADLAIPRLLDEDVDNIDIDNAPGVVSDVLGVPVSGINYKVTSSPNIYDIFGPSCPTESTIEGIRFFCDFPSNIDVIIPDINDRPWTPPFVYICLHEKYFTKCGLFLPIPRFISQYCARRKIAISQLSPAAIRNAIGLYRLGRTAGVEIDVSFFEHLTRMSKMKDKTGIVYISSFGHTIVTGAKSKTYRWKNSYFFAELSHLLVESPGVMHVSGWNVSAGSLFIDRGMTMLFFLPCS